MHSRTFAAAAASQAHTKCKLVNGVYVVTLDSPNVKVCVSFSNDLISFYFVLNNHYRNDNSYTLYTNLSYCL